MESGSSSFRSRSEALRGRGHLLHGELTERILGAAFEVHTQLGPGLLESIYEACLCVELDAAGVAYRRQADIPIFYKDAKLDLAFVADIIVEDKVLLELKAVQQLHPIHHAQLLSNLRLTGLRVGLLMNFNVVSMKDGIVRRVL